MSRSPRYGHYWSDTDRVPSGAAQMRRRVAANIRHSFELAVRPQDRQPGPVRRVLPHEGIDAPAR